MREGIGGKKKKRKWTLPERQRLKNSFVISLLAELIKMDGEITKYIKTPCTAFHFQSKSKQSLDRPAEPPFILLAGR